MSNNQWNNLSNRVPIFVRGIPHIAGTDSKNAETLLTNFILKMSALQTKTARRIYFARKEGESYEKKKKIEILETAFSKLVE